MRTSDTRHVDNPRKISAPICNFLSEERKKYVFSFEEDQDDDEGDVLDSESRALGIPIRDEYVGGYYDFLINEGSYKFWAVFQVITQNSVIFIKLRTIIVLFFRNFKKVIMRRHDKYFLVQIVFTIF